MEIVVGAALLLGSMAGIVTSLALLWSKVVKPLYHFIRHAGEVVDVISDIPDWHSSVNDTLETCKDEVRIIKEELSTVKEILEDHMKNHTI